MYETELGPAADQDPNKFPEYCGYVRQEDAEEDDHSAPPGIEIARVSNPGMPGSVGP